MRRHLSSIWRLQQPSFSLRLLTYKGSCEGSVGGVSVAHVIGIAIESLTELFQSRGRLFLDGALERDKSIGFLIDSRVTLDWGNLVRRSIDDERLDHALAGHFLRFCEARL